MTSADKGSADEAAPLGFLPDQPTADDILGYQAYADTWARIILNSSLPLTIGIYGDWGSGKSSLMLMLERALESSRGRGKICPVRFNAWQYQQADTVLWRSLVLTVARGLKDKHWLADNSAEKIERHIFESASWAGTGAPAQAGTGLGRLTGALRLLVNIGSLATGGGAKGSDVAADLDHVIKGVRRQETQYERERTRSCDEFMRLYEEMVSEALEAKPARKAGARRTLVVFLDDLDRCEPDKAKAVLEALKVFLQVPNTVYVLGLNMERLQQLLCEAGPEWRDPDRVERYISKIVNVPFPLPPLEPDQCAAFVLEKTRSHAKQTGRETDESEALWSQIIGQGTERNPRNLIRSANEAIVLASCLNVSLKRLKLWQRLALAAMFVVLKYGLKDANGTDQFKQGLQDYPSRFLDVYAWIVAAHRGRPLEGAEGPLASAATELVRTHTGLGQLLAGAEMSAVIADLSPEDVRRMFLYGSPYRGVREIVAEGHPLVRTARESGDAGQVLGALGTVRERPSEDVFEVLRRLADASRLPVRLFAEIILARYGRGIVKGFDDNRWVDIVGPAGTSAFQMQRYPVTNVEYAEFFQKTGGEDLQAPKYWDNGEYPPHLASTPVVGVPYRDAEKYADSRGAGLPTAQQWTAAAFWDPNEQRYRKLPFGDGAVMESAAFPNEYCLVEESKELLSWLQGFAEGEVCPVGVLKKNVSAQGVHDMAGNVAEWIEGRRAFGGSARYSRSSMIFHEDRGVADPLTELSVQDPYPSIGIRLVRRSSP